MIDLIRLLRSAHLLGAGLILLGLWGYAIGPIAALRAAVADPVALSAICGHSETSPSSEDGAPACRACPLCAPGLWSPFLPDPGSAASREAWSGVVWPLPPPASPSRSHHPAGQARAPPVAS